MTVRSLRPEIVGFVVSLDKTVTVACFVDLLLLSSLTITVTLTFPFFEKLYASLKEIVVFVSSTMLSTKIVGSTSIPASISILLISNLGLVLSTTLIFTVNFLP